ncbi:hypothetical protein XELAEV_18003191mg [Xenopus laevis]|nr:hypothetical protein XELAEV_18003191mg [Xenopus laevis]
MYPVNMIFKAAQRIFAQLMPRYPPGWANTWASSLYVPPYYPLCAPLFLCSPLTHVLLYFVLFNPLCTTVTPLPPLFVVHLAQSHLNFSSQGHHKSPPPDPPANCLSVSAVLPHTHGQHR